MVKHGDSFSIHETYASRLTIVTHAVQTDHAAQTDHADHADWLTMLTMLTDWPCWLYWLTDHADRADWLTMLTLLTRLTILTSRDDHTDRAEIADKPHLSWEIKVDVRKSSLTVLIMPTQVTKMEVLYMAILNFHFCVFCIPGMPSGRLQLQRTQDEIGPKEYPSGICWQENAPTQSFHPLWAFGAFDLIAQSRDKIGSIEAQNLKLRSILIFWFYTHRGHPLDQMKLWRPWLCQVVGWPIDPQEHREVFMVHLVDY